MSERNFRLDASRSRSVPAQIARHLETASPRPYPEKRPRAPAECLDDPARWLAAVLARCSQAPHLAQTVSSLGAQWLGIAESIECLAALAGEEAHHDGQAVVLPISAGRRSAPDPRRSSGHGWSPALTRREREVAALISQGLTNRQIGETLILSIRTVERHVENLYAKLGVGGTAARAAVAVHVVRNNLSTA